MTIKFQTVKQKIQEAFPSMSDDQFDRHESDLYVKYSPELDEWLKKNYEYYGNVTKFRSQIDGETWIDIPFAAWEEKYKGKAMEKGGETKSGSKSSAWWEYYAAHGALITGRGYIYHSGQSMASGGVIGFNISDETLKKLDEIYTYDFYDQNVNVVPKDKAYELSIGFEKSGEGRDEWRYIGRNIKPTKKEMTLEYIQEKIGADSLYVNFSKYFNDLISKYGLHAYPTTYGIGVFVAVGFRKDIEESKNKVEEILNNLGVKYTTEYSEAGWVFRYKISKSADNIKRIKEILESKASGGLMENGGVVTQRKEGMKKLVHFINNYRHDFIEKVWGDDYLAKHLRQKFNQLGDSTREGVMKWISSLDAENTDKLFTYVEAFYAKGGSMAKGGRVGKWSIIYDFGVGVPDLVEFADEALARKFYEKKKNKSKSRGYGYVKLLKDNDEIEFFDGSEKYTSYVGKKKKKVGGSMADGGSTANDKDLNDIIFGYKEAILWAEVDDDENPLENNYGMEDFAEGTNKAIDSMMSEYIRQNKDAIEKSGLDYEQVGRDIWFTQKGHGVGFFDRGLDEGIEKQLAKSAKELARFPEIEVGDNKKIHVRGVEKYEDGGFAKKQATAANDVLRKIYKVSKEEARLFPSYSEREGAKGKMKLRIYKSKKTGDYYYGIVMPPFYEFGEAIYIYDKNYRYKGEAGSANLPVVSEDELTEKDFEGTEFVSHDWSKYHELP